MLDMAREQAPTSRAHTEPDDYYLPPLPRRFPCKDEYNRYSGCISLKACAALGTERCWDGRPLGPNGLLPTHEAPQRQVWSQYRSKVPCATCQHAVEVPDAERAPLADGSYKDTRLVTCRMGFWTARCSIYVLNNHRMPLRPEVAQGCDHYAATPEDQLRPELIAQREADRRRSRNRRQLLKESAAKKASQTWGEVL